MASSVEYKEEQLNYYRICYVTTDILTEGLREIFKQEWDNRYKATLGEWKDSPQNGLDFQNGESRKNQKKHARLLTTMTKGNRAEWDCTMLFYAILYSDCINSLNPVVKTNVDNLRLFRNEEFAHIARGHLSDVEFQNAISRVENAFNGLGLSTVKIQDVKTQKYFPTEQQTRVLKKVDDLKQEVQEKEKEVQEKNKRLHETGKELREKEEQRQTLEEQLNSDAPSFCILSPKPSHHVADRDSDVSEIRQKLKELKRCTGLSYLYISGNPGSGKSQIASLVAKRFFDEVTEKIPSTAFFVMTLNAGNSETLLESYVSFARHLKCPEYAVTNTFTSKDLNTIEKIRSLKTLISPKIELYSSWLLIVDNVTSMSHLDGNLPDPGNGQWARGQLLITTQDTAAIPLSSSFIQHISVSRGMDPHEARSLLEILSEVTDPEMEKVCQVLDYQPLALASAATYVREVRKTGLSSSFGFIDFLKKLNQGKRSTTEAMLTETNPSYKNSMTAATTLAVEKAIATDKVLEHTFNFLSVCAPHPLSIEIVVNYVRKVDQELKDPEMLATRIRKCSLLLFEKDNSGVYIRMHQIVQDVIGAIMKTVAKSKELEAVDGAIHSFCQGISQTLGEDDLYTLVKSKNVVPHLVTLSDKIDGLFTEEGITDAEKARSSTSYDYFSNFTTLGITCKKHCEFRTALKYFNIILRLTQREDVFADTDVATAYNNMVSVHRALGDLQQAKECYDRAQTIHLEKLGPEHVYVAGTYHNLGVVHSALGDLQQAKECLDRALTIRLKKLGPEHVKVANTYNNLGTVHHDLGDLQQAKECYDRALTIHLEKLGPEHVYVAGTYNNLGSLHRALGDLQQAKECHDRALTIRLKRLGPEHVDVAATYNNVGAVHYDLGDLRQAEDFLDRALTSCLKKLGPEHNDVVAVRSNLEMVQGKRENVCCMIS